MNPFLKVALNAAKRLITKPKESKRMMNKALRKSNRVKGDKSLVSEIKTNVGLFFNMLADYFTGKYRKIPVKSAIKILGALIYFVFVIDFVPDFLAVIGLTDDVAVMAWVIASITGDIDKYKEWKENRKIEKLVNEN